MITWDPKYSTGLEMIDKQHKLLFEFLNDLEFVVAEHKGSTYLHQGLPFLKAYAKAHFGIEEDCMFRSVCSTADENRVAHQAFLAHLADVEARFATEGYSEGLLAELHRFLEAWIKGHILRCDTRLKGVAQG